MSTPVSPGPWDPSPGQHPGSQPHPAVPAPAAQPYAPPPAGSYGAPSSYGGYGAPQGPPGTVGIAGQTYRVATLGNRFLVRLKLLCYLSPRWDDTSRMQGWHEKLSKDFVVSTR